VRHISVNHPKIFSFKCSIPKKNKTTYDDEMAVYTLEAIQHKLTLSLGSLLLFALLTGGDYNKGTPGCGQVVAAGLVKCGYGDQLLDAINSNEDFNIFAPHFRDQICAELRKDLQGQLGTRHPSLANQFPDDFLKREIIDLYTKPLISDSCNKTVLTSDWKSCGPRIAEITQFFYNNLGWKTESVLKTNLQSHLWEEIFSQMLFSVRHIVLDHK
jgi:5'-3' exonuclease